MHRINFTLFILLLLFFSEAQAQELNCTVTVNDAQIEGNSYTYISELKPRIEEYINDYRWTEVEFEEEERIECQIQIILESANSNYDFGSRIILSARRPIYGTTTLTTSIILSDDNWQFNYPQGRTLIHDELQFDNLTGTLDFYMNVLLGYDFDSFSELGGEAYFQKAQQIVDLAQTTSAIGWTRAANNRRNKFNLIADLLNPSYRPLRVAYYQYHRLGLDAFTADAIASRSLVLQALTDIRDSKRRATSNYLYDLFFDTKSREISGIFNEATPQIRRQAYNLLVETDPGHLSDYNNLQN